MNFHLLCDEQRMADEIVRLRNDNRALRDKVMEQQRLIDAMRQEIADGVERHRAAVNRLNETVREFLR